MIAALLALLPGRAWFYGLAAAALAAVISWHVLHEVSARREAIAAAITSRDAEWQARIARANAETEIERAALQGRADDAGREAEAAQSRLDDALKELERANASLPNVPSCGLDRARTRLLDRLRDN